MSDDLDQDARAADSSEIREVRVRSVGGPSSVRDQGTTHEDDPESPELLETRAERDASLTLWQPTFVQITLLNGATLIVVAVTWSAVQYVFTVTGFGETWMGWAASRLFGGSFVLSAITALIYNFFTFMAVRLDIVEERWRPDDD